MLFNKTRQYYNSIWYCLIKLHSFFNLVCFHHNKVLHNWYNKGHGMYYPVYKMVHIKDPLWEIVVLEMVVAGVLSSYLGGPLPYV